MGATSLAHRLDRGPGGRGRSGTTGPARTGVICALLMLLALSVVLLGDAPTHAIAPARSPSQEGIAGAAGVSSVHAVSPGYRLESAPLQTYGGPFSYPTHASWLAYDPVDAAFWVAAPPSSVDVFTVHSLANYPYEPLANASYPVGSEPFGVAVDPTTGDVFVTNSGSNNVSILSDSGKRLGSVAVGLVPEGIAFDSGTGDVYVADMGSANVTVLGGSPYHSVANLTVGSDPIGLAYDPQDSEVAVADSGSNEVSVIDASSNSVVTTVGVGVQPYGVGWDNRSGNFYVTNNGSANLSVIGSSNRVVATVGTASGIPLEGVVYDNWTNQVYVGGGKNDLVVVDPANESVVDYANVDPAGLAYAPPTGWLCMTNTLNGTFECLDPTFPLPVPEYSVSFTEVGLSAGETWCLSLYYVPIPWYWYLGSYEDPIGAPSTTNTTIPLSLPNATYTYVAYADSPGCSYSTSGTEISSQFTVRGPGLVVHVNFGPPPSNATYPVEFQEKGLPDLASVGWSVTLGGVPESGRAGDDLNFTEPNGSFSYTVGFVSGYTASPAEGIAPVQGRELTIVIVYNATSSPPRPTIYSAVFTESGLPTGTSWEVSVGAISATSSSENVSFPLTNGTYTYAVAVVAGFVTPPSGTFYISGANVTVLLPFSAVVYPVLIVEIGLPSGAAWTTTIANSTGGFNDTQSTDTTAILFFVPNGTYTIHGSADIRGYTSHLPTPTFRIDGGPLASSPVVDFTSVPGSGRGAPSATYLGGLTASEVGAVSLGALIAVLLGAVYARRQQLRREGLEIVSTMRQLEETDPWPGPRK